MKPTIALIAGAATSCMNYSSLQSLFQLKGYPTTCGDPPSITASNATTVTVDNDISFIYNSVLSPLLSQGKDVILLAHSYGGTYGPGAVKGLSKKERTAAGKKGGVVGIVWAASFLPDVGQTALEAFGLADSTSFPEGIELGKKEDTVIFTDPTNLWPSYPTTFTDQWIKTLKPCSLTALGSPVSYAAWQDPAYKGRLAFVSMKDDALVAEAVKQADLAKSGINLTATVDGGHGIDLEGKQPLVDAVTKLIANW